jgi:predicted transcriptional regulator
MIVESLLHIATPHVKLQDSPQAALRLMDELKMEQLPVVGTNGQYVGMLTRKIIEQAADSSSIESLPLLPPQDTSVYSSQHFYNVLRQANNYDLQWIAVIDEEEKLIGLVRVQDAIKQFVSSYAMQEKGAIILLSMPARDYSLSHISRLVEENNAKIISVNVGVDEKDPQQLLLTIKIDKPDVSRIVATLKRFNYHVVATFHSTELEQIDRSRLELLLRYLDI